MQDSRRRELLEREEPHPLPKGVSCSCIVCEDWRSVRVQRGNLVVGITPDRKQVSGDGSPTWDPAGPFVWGESVREPALVLGFVPKDAPGGHLDAVLIWSERLGFRSTSRKWLKVLA